MDINSLFDLTTDHLEEISLGFSAVLSTVSYFRYLSKKHTADVVHDTPEFIAGNEVVEAMTSTQGGDVKYASIRGRVVPLTVGQSVKTASEMPAVIQKNRTVEFRMIEWVNLIWLNSNRQLEQTLKYIPFGLRNPNVYKPTQNSIPPVLIVDDISSAEMHADLLVKAGSNYKPTEVSFFHTLLSFLTGDVSVGVETSDLVLPVDSVITIVGEISKMNDGQYRITKPADYGTPYLFTTKPIKALKTGLQLDATDSWILAIFTAAVTFAATLAVGFKWWPKFQIRRVQRRIARERNANPPEGLHHSQICVICLTNPRELVLMPCGHVCVCADCSVHINQKCPICRKTISSVHVAYLS